MIGDYFTKPTQGRKHKWQRNRIMNLTPESNAGSQECVEESAGTEPAMPCDPTPARGSKSLMSSWTSRRSSKRSLKGPAGPPAPACPAGRVTSAPPGEQRSSGDRRQACAESRRACAESRRGTPPTRANTRGNGEECSRKQSHGNSTDSEVMSRRFDSYLEVAKRALNRERNRNVSLC